MQNNKEVEICFGALAEKLDIQLKIQGFEIENLEIYQKGIEAILRLHFLGSITESERSKIEKKLFNKILKNIKPIKTSEAKDAE
jgi:hypothetical protein